MVELQRAQSRRQGAVMVTGGGAGIGKAVAVSAAEAGYDVAVLDIDGAAARRTAEEASGHGVHAVGVACDVTSETGVASAIATAIDEVGGLWGLVTSAGIDRGGLVHELDFDRWQQVIAVNLNGTFLAAKHVLKHLVAKRGGGSIVCVSSPWAYLSTPGGASAYCASKGGVSALTRSMALDYAQYDIRVNAIVPGATDTELMWANTPADRREVERAKVGAALPMRRLATPQEIASGVIWLLDLANSYVTGTELVIDGGLMAKGSIDV